MTNDTAPATKSDLTALKAEVLGEIAAVKNELSLAIATATDEMRSDISSLREESKRAKDEIKLYFDIVAARMRRDFVGANHDQIEILKDHDTDHVRRIEQLEQRFGVIA